MSVKPLTFSASPNSCLTYVNHNKGNAANFLWFTADFNSKQPIICCIANYSHNLQCSLYLSPFLIVLSLRSLVIYTAYFSVFSSDERETGDDESPTQEVKSESQSEEQPQQQQQQQEGEEEEKVVQEEEEMETEPSHSAPSEAESQPS